MSKDVCLYIFGGYIKTGGILQDGNPWEGLRILLGQTSEVNKKPVTAVSVKADKSVLSQISQLVPGVPVHAYFDCGKVVDGKQQPPTCVLIQPLK